MITHIAPKSYENFACTDDTTVSWEGQRIHGLDVTGDGHDLIVSPGDLGAQRLGLHSPFGNVTITGLRGDYRSVAPQDALDCYSAIKRLSVINCRFTGIHGQQTGRHGDCLQLGNGAAVDLLWIEGCTFGSAYQVLMLANNCKGLVMRNCNIVNETYLRVQNSIALYLYAPMPIILDNVYIDASWDAGHRMQLHPQAKLAGMLIAGTPPSGDFCP